MCLIAFAYTSTAEPVLISTMGVEGGGTSIIRSHFSQFDDTKANLFNLQGYQTAQVTSLGSDLSHYATSSGGIARQDLVQSNSRAGLAYVRTYVHGDRLTAMLCDTRTDHLFGMFRADALMSPDATIEFSTVSSASGAAIDAGTTGRGLYVQTGISSTRSLTQRINQIDEESRSNIAAEFNTLYSHLDTSRITSSIGVMA